jgi:hypothetical protein
MLAMTRPPGMIDGPVRRAAARNPAGGAYDCAKLEIAYGIHSSSTQRRVISFMISVIMPVLFCKIQRRHPACDGQNHGLGMKSCKSAIWYL